jgi:hypothetical protein
MDTRLATTHGTRRRLLATIVAVVIVVPLAATSTTLASSAACRVTNLDTGSVQDGLQAAVDAATAGHRLTVEGTCHGTTIIAKDLVITGIEAESLDRPTLDGDGLGTVVTVLGVAVTIEGLTIEGGVMPWTTKVDGGGIKNKRGTLTLRDVTVRGNKARRGSGIFNTGTLSLDAGSRISSNANRGSGFGAGVYNQGTLAMNGASSISENDARNGSGVYLDRGTLTMNDHSAITDNEWNGLYARRGTVVMNGHSSIRGTALGGGVRLREDSALTMNGSSTIAGNHSTNNAGGVWVHDGSTLTMNDAATITRNTGGAGIYVYGGTLVGVICAPKANANVFDNTPDDCEPRSP